MLGALTSEEIERFASRENVKRVPVENFLMTVSNNPNRDTALANLDMDARLYHWSRDTVMAITAGILLSGGMR